MLPLGVPGSSVGVEHEFARLDWLAQSAGPGPAASQHSASTLRECRHFG